MAQRVKNLPAILKTWVQLLGQEDSLEEGTATHTSILAWRIPWTEDPHLGLCPEANVCLENPMDRGSWQATSPWGLKELDTTEHSQEEVTV